MMKRIIALVVALAAVASLSAREPVTRTLASPDGRLRIELSIGDRVEWSVSHDGTEVIAPSQIAMKVAAGKKNSTWGVGSRFSRSTGGSVRGVIPSPLYKKAEVADSYNWLTITFADGFAIDFRAYDDGAAYRFRSLRKGALKVFGETASFRFSADRKAYCPYVKPSGKADDLSYDNQFFNSFENQYTVTPLSGIDSKRLMFLPVLVELDGGRKLCITESDLEDYPGMYLANPSGATSLDGVFAPSPKASRTGGHNDLQQIVTSRHDYLAATSGLRSFPWRVAIVSKQDIDLADNDMVYRLAKPCAIGDTRWIKAGKVAWEWWNHWGIYGAKFKAGVNNETYKYYIDFAARNDIEYVILDEGWSVRGACDLRKVVNGIDIPELVAYGAERGVGIILWAGYNALNADIDGLCRYYSEMGVKGFKIDFMDRDDQQIVGFYHKVAETCAKYHLVVDMHGAYKPTGHQRTYPNVLNHEGVAGLEQLKWSPRGYDQVTYDVQLPFIRQVAGPMDYTQGAMRNATQYGYHPDNVEPMSQGTRCRQLALYVVFESPLNMLCDSPDNYDREPECRDFIAAIPTVWDRTVALGGSVGEWVAMARARGGKWYVGGITSWSGCEQTIDLSFLGAGEWRVELFTDTPNSETIARSYAHHVFTLGENGRSLTVRMASGGGFAAVIERVKD